MAISSTPTAAEINVELGRAASAPFSMNGAEERALAGVPSGPITFADFIGKSAKPTYAEYVAYLDSIKSGDSTAFNGLSNILPVLNNWYKLLGNTIAKSGTMYGSPFAPNTRTTADSTGTRVIQHMVQTEAEMDYLIANNIDVCMRRGNNQNVGDYTATTRNGYTSQSYSPNFNGTTQLSLIWWDGEDAWERIFNNARTNINDRL